MHVYDHPFIIVPGQPVQFVKARKIISKKEAAKEMTMLAIMNSQIV
jgi:hypothetical protein